MNDACSEIDVGAARARLGDFRIVDVREPAGFEGPLGHIAGAERVPLGGVADVEALPGAS
jgi:rhodanese-related sulfurtransferase